MKRICSALLTIALLCAPILPASAATAQTGQARFCSTRIFFEGVDVGFLDGSGRERCALTYQDVEYIPLATVGLWMGADTLWAEDTGTITITSNGKDPVYYSLDKLHYDMRVTRPGDEEEYDGKDGMEVQVLPRATVTVDETVRTFFDPQGDPVSPILFLDCVYLPLRGIAELMDMRVMEFYPRFDEDPDFYYLNIYRPPTQGELEEANAYFVAVRSRLNAIRALCENGEAHTQEEFLGNVRKIQSDLSAIQGLPRPSFPGVGWYIDKLQQSVTLVLASVDFYLPVEESSGARVEIYGSDQRFHSNSDAVRTPEERWTSFVSSKMIQSGENIGRANSFFDAAENSCAACEVYMAAAASGQATATASIRTANRTSPSQDAGKTAPFDPPLFVDAADIEHQEAVSALVKLGIVQGFSDGGFHPKDTISRAQAAKFLAHIMNGGRDFEDFSTSEPSFSDTHGYWAEAYIEYCADMGIISGCGDGTFAPEGEITGIALVKMALGALGYAPEAYQLIGPQWSVRTDELARSMDPGLYSGLSGVDLNQPISRDDAAQILYNALLAVPRMVKPVPQPDGTVEWQFVPAIQADGTASSLLWERFAIRPEDLTFD